MIDVEYFRQHPEALERMPEAGRKEIEALLAPADPAQEAEMLRQMEPLWGPLPDWLEKDRPA